MLAGFERSRLIMAAACLLLVSPLSAAPDDSLDVGLSGLSIIDIRTGAVAERQTVFIRDGIIESILPDDEYAEQTDAAHYYFPGNFALPGLWDMHVHFRGGAELADDNKLWMRQYLAYGVTTVRDAGGDIPEQVLSWKAAIDHGTQIGPRIFTSLRKLDGPAAFRPGSVEIGAKHQIDPALDHLTAAGADFFKLNDGALEPFYIDVLLAAESRSLKSAAHIPITTPFEAVVEAGLDSVEHDFYLLKAASADEQSVMDAVSAKKPAGGLAYFAVFHKFAKNMNIERARRMFRLMAKARMAITPTIYVTNRWFSASATDSDPDAERLQQVPTEIRRTYRVWQDILLSRSPERRAADMEMKMAARQLVGIAANEGVRILAGSDTGASNPYVYPGHSLHRELRELTLAGLSPLQAIQAATINAARWMGDESESGTIEVGKRADILILRDNPLRSIDNTESIAAVVAAGEVHQGDALEKLGDLPLKK